MSDFINEIKKQKIYHGEKLEAEALIIAQKVLHNMGLDFIPQSYIDFLKHYNGLKFDGSYLFGATVDDDLDIIDQNEQMKKPEQTILLGYNDFDLLCYNYNLKRYQVVDRQDFQVLDTYNEDERDYALSKILNF
ncbi:MAG: YrhA family protein [Alphaproteobacteria bacterium]|nr:YrhA family protein [Alphaproteobacteria bacterium]